MLEPRSVQVATTVPAIPLFEPEYSEPESWIFKDYDRVNVKKPMYNTENDNHSQYWVFILCHPHPCHPHQRSPPTATDTVEAIVEAATADSNTGQVFVAGICAILGHRTGW